MKESGKNKIKVFVGLSGGVDSSVSAALLKEATPNNFEKLFGRPTPEGFRGYDVTGVFIRTWQPDFIECSFREDRLDAMRVAAKLDIPFLECDAEEEYKREVADYMIEEYRKGRTPNPDIFCNRAIKFGVFWNFAKEHGADFIATGHYAISECKVESVKLKAAPDKSKDQSYFLYRLTEEDLKHVLFPIGHLEKTEVRKLADKLGLNTATKKDSQGICMLGDLDLKDFLSHYIERKVGEVLDEEGNTIGHHDGAVFLTLGERHGFTINKKTPDDSPYYIIKKDVEKNTITVSQNPEPSEDSSESKIIHLEMTSWVSENPQSDKKYNAVIRYHGEGLLCQVTVNKNDSAIIQFEKNIRVAKGQSVVIYDKDICLGGGIVN